jgi:hypothetical protein
MPRVFEAEEIRPFSNPDHSKVVTCLPEIGSARIMHETRSRDRENGRATGQPSRGTAGLDLRRTPLRYVARVETRARLASGSWGLGLGEKDGRIRGRSRRFVHRAGWSI